MADARQEVLPVKVGREGGFQAFCGSWHSLCGSAVDRTVDTDGGDRPSMLAKGSKGAKGSEPVIVRGSGLGGPMDDGVHLSGLTTQLLS